MLLYYMVYVYMSLRMVLFTQAKEEEQQPLLDEALPSKWVIPAIVCFLILYQSIRTLHH